MTQYGNMTHYTTQAKKNKKNSDNMTHATTWQTAYYDTNMTRVYDGVVTAGRKKSADRILGRKTLVLSLVLIELDALLRVRDSGEGGGGWRREEGEEKRDGVGGRERGRGEF